MQAKREQWRYADGAKVWVGKYSNSHNMPHWHYDCELISVERGSLNIVCENSAYTVTAGQAFFINSGQVHFMHAVSPDTLIKIIIFDYDIIRPFTANLTLSSPALTADYGIAGIYSRLKDELRDKKPFWEYCTVNEVSLLAVSIFRSERTVKKEKPVRMMERFKTLLTEIDEKYEFYDLNAAAELMCMNPAYFSRLFHKLTGMTFSQYLNYVRCENAVELLKTETDTPVTEISLRCGFSTIRNFNRIFKEFTGYTPKSMPKDFVMKESFTYLNETNANPTSVECELLESSDD